MLEAANGRSDRAQMLAALLLVLSNMFMTAAWYGHLRFRETALYKVVIISWLIAFFEYCLQVPANRLGAATFSVTQLKVMQEVISLIVFAIFSVLFLGESFKWNHAVSFGFLVLAVAFGFKR